MVKTTKKFVFHSFGFKGFVRVAETDSLRDVRSRILEKVDGHMIPQGDWIFSVDNIQVGEKQEEDEMAWEDIIDQNAKVMLVQKTFHLKRKSPPAAFQCKQEVKPRPDNGNKPSQKRKKSENFSRRPKSAVCGIIDLTSDTKTEATDSTPARIASNSAVIKPDDEPSDQALATRSKVHRSRRKSKSRPVGVKSKEEHSDHVPASEVERDQGTPRRDTTSTPVTPESELNNPDTMESAEGENSTNSPPSNGRIQTEVGPNEQPTGASTATNTAVLVKEETRKKFAAERKKCYMKYGEKFLLHRHSEKGIRRLGGNLQNRAVWPRENHPSIQEDEYPMPLHLLLGREGDICRHDFGYLAFNTTWQPNGPLFAGQETAAVAHVPDYFKRTGDPFPVFMKRTLTNLHHEAEGKLIGWEYVGSYKYVPLDPDDDEAIFYESANNFSKASKREIARKLNISYNNDGYGCINVEEWRDRLVEAIDQEKKPHPPHSLAAKCLGLGFEPNMSGEKLCEMLMELDEFHEQDLIKFVYYDDRVYNYCSGGKTKSNKDGVIISNSASGEPAKAQDWYNFATVNMLFKY